MTYKIIQPPFTLDFREMSKKELKSYYQWFMESIPERINELEKAVCRTKNYENWKADYSVNSLIKLGEWFAINVEKRQMTAEEIYEQKKSLLFPIELSDWELTNKTFSLAFDIGMYLAKVFMENNNNLKWSQPLRSKRYADYGQPVLDGFGKLSLNPVSVIVTLAYRIARGKTSGNCLIELYEIWSNMISNN